MHTHIATHYKWMKTAIEVAESALEVREVPVSCVYVYNNEIIAKGFNQTNITLNGTRHAEFEGYNRIRSKYPDNWRQVLKETDLYVTVEPCIMCASLLRQIGIRRVFFGCGNERFGGNGSVFKVNRDYPSCDHDKSKLDPPYTVYPGFLSKEAIMLLRRFYLLENEKSPTSLGKKQRKLELKEFPKLNYKDYLSVADFVDMFGYEYEYIYNNNEFLEFDDTTGKLVNPPQSNPKKQKKEG